MLFLANRENLDSRRLVTRIHNHLQTQADSETAPIEQVWYHTAAGNKIGVRATVDPIRFLDREYPCSEAELQVAFDFPRDLDYDCYRIQWVERERELMVGWHQDETHSELGPCHFQLDYNDTTVQRAAATYLDVHPLNVFDSRIDDLVSVLNTLDWSDGTPTVDDDILR